MNTLTLIVEILTIAIFFIAGVTKLSMSKEKPVKNMAWTEDFSAIQIKGIGFVELLGALGILIPVVTGIAPILIPISAAGLVLAMIGAFITHLRRSEKKEASINVILGVLCIATIYLELV